VQPGRGRSRGARFLGENGLVARGVHRVAGSPSRSRRM
jgi:hypothetical protein